MSLESIALHGQGEALLSRSDPRRQTTPSARRQDRIHEPVQLPRQLASSCKCDPATDRPGKQEKPAAGRLGVSRLTAWGTLGCARVDGPPGYTADDDICSPCTNYHGPATTTLDADRPPLVGPLRQLAHDSPSRARQTTRWTNAFHAHPSSESLSSIRSSASR